MATDKDITKELRRIANKHRATSSAWFFKTEKGQYGYGDKFLGITVPKTRLVAKKYKDISRSNIEKLLKSSWHEDRLCALIILNNQYLSADSKEKKRIATFYLKLKSAVNNWDLVDVSAHVILGSEWLELMKKGPKSVKKKQLSLLRSKRLWDRRIGIVATLTLIRAKEFGPTFFACTELLNDTEDLIHKATGWMLREVGKKDCRILEMYLNEYASRMPRTMLRYAIEHFSPQIRQMYLQKKRIK